MLRFVWFSEHQGTTQCTESPLLTPPNVCDRNVLVETLNDGGRLQYLYRVFEDVHTLWGLLLRKLINVSTLVFFPLIVQGGPRPLT